MALDYRPGYVEEVHTLATALEYKEEPVSIITFLKDDYYLGKVTRNLSAVYPGWLRDMAAIFTDDTKYLIVLTGSVGIGKSMVVCGYCLPYILYRISCLADPWKHFEKQDAGKMDVMFFNLTKNLSKSRGFSYMQTSLMQSPWFKERGSRVTTGLDPQMELALFNWVLTSPYVKGFGTLGGNVVAGVMDEVDSPTESDGSKKRVLSAYENTVRRFESRFVKNGHSIGRLFLVASKQDELSFLEVFIEEMKSSQRVLVFDKAQWEVLPKTNYSGKKFFVMAGDSYTAPKIIEPEERDKFLKENMRVIAVPEEHRFDFERDIIGAMRDLAGISVRGIRRHKFIPAERFIRQCIDENREPPMEYETIEIGLNDEIELIQFLDMSKLRNNPRNPRFIHIDIAFTHDALGLACSTIADWVDMDIEMADGTYTKQRMPIVETEFIYRLKAREGDRIPIHKVRKLLLDVKARGLALKNVTLDLRLASEDTTQLLQKAGIEAGYLTVDKDIKPYLEFKNLLFEQRWICYSHKYLQFELRHLEFDRQKNKIEHPDKVKDIEILSDGGIRDVVMMGSKDVADAVVGSVYLAISNAKQPIQIEQYTNALKALKGAPPDAGLGPDWFISDKSKQQLSSPVLLPGGKPNKDSVEKLKKALTKLRGMKGGGIF